MGCGVIFALFSKCWNCNLFYDFKVSEVIGVESVGLVLLWGLRVILGLDEV